MTRQRITIILTVLITMAVTLTAANSKQARSYTETDPLVIICDWDFPPFEFTDNSGNPAGYNIEVLDIILDRLNIPHRYEMREWHQAIEIFKAGQADLIHAIGEEFDMTPYVQTTDFINVYRVKVAYKKGTLPLRSIRDLSYSDTIVMKKNDYVNSYLQKQPFRPYYMKFETPREALVALTRNEIKYFLWGAVPLELKIHEMALDDIETEDIDIPIGELHIVGYDSKVINAIDDEYARMRQAGELEVISDKWFAPERIHNDTPLYAFYIITATLLMALWLLTLGQLLRRRVKRAVARTQDVGNMMAQALSMGDFYIFEHDIATGYMKNVYGNLLPVDGMEAEEFFSELHTNDLANVRAIYGHLLQTPDKPYNLSYRWKNRYLTGNSIAEMENGRLAHIVNTVKDITQEVEEEQANNELGSRYMKIFHTNIIAMSFYDTDGMLIDLNDSMRKLCEFDKEREAFFRKTSMFDVPVLKNDFNRFSKHSFHVCQHMYYPEINIDKYIDFRIRPTFDDQDNLLYYIVTSRDVTAERDTELEQRRQQKELKQIYDEINRYEKELRYMLEKSNLYVWNMDFETQQIAFTRSLTKAEFTESFDDYLNSLYEDEREIAAISIHRLKDKLEPFYLVHHFRYTPIEKRPQWHAISGMPTYDEEGHLNGFFGVLRNIDDLMDAQERLKKERTRAEVSGMMKSAFLANMTHEIRTPLNAIVGFSDLLQVIDDPADRKEFIRIIRNNCDMLLRLINDILEASDTNQSLTITSTALDFSQVFDDICQTLEQRVQEPGVQFIKDNPYETYPTELDKGRVQQVITNFVTNAVKYTHQGHIKVGYREQDGGLYIYCEDTGAGIPKDKQASVFERFVKLNDFVQGTGLGLSICKNIAERCGGKIGVFSEGEGKGSTFWLWIPCKQTKPTT